MLYAVVHEPTVDAMDLVAAKRTPMIYVNNYISMVLVRWRPVRATGE
jgi:hypothetical protein